MGHFGDELPSVGNQLRGKGKDGPGAEYMGFSGGEHRPRASVGSVTLESNRLRGRAPSSIEQEKQEAEQYLKHLVDKTTPLKPQNMPNMERSSAAKKWELARKFAGQAGSLEVWGGGSRGINGIYNYVERQGRENASSPPCFQQYADPNKWLYVAINGEWWLGEYNDAKDRQVPKEGTEIGLFRSSDAVRPGTMPHLVDHWDVYSEPGRSTAMPSLKVWLADQAALEWQKVRLECAKSPVIALRGGREEIWAGYYDYVASEGQPGTPPVFQHQQCRKLWLYLGTDQRWWISSTGDMDMRADRGSINSCQVQPGTHPCDATAWYTFSSCKEQEINITRRREHEMPRAVDEWAEARTMASAVQIWGKESKYGEYEFVKERDGAMDPPMYRSKRHADIWLYVANDGAWWLGNITDADDMKPRGYMRSEPVSPGTLPYQVRHWNEQTAGHWKMNENITCLTPEDVGEMWAATRREAGDEYSILQLEGVHGQPLNGLYDFVSEEGNPEDPPCFQHQINQDLWLYVATDGCWWVGNSMNMEKKAPKGKMSSGPIQPGTHPRDAEGWQVYDVSAQTFKAAESVNFS
jgi:hypothetical protein